MNPSEFNRWWRDFAIRFPDTGAWLADLAKRPDGDPKATLAAWADVLKDVAFVDALEANKRLASGEEDRPEYARREDTPAIIRDIARRLESGRGPKRVEDWRERRYDCPECLDSGRVEVVHPSLMKVVLGILAGKVEEQAFWDCHHRVATARCGACDRGKPRGVLIGTQAPDYRGPLEKTARFSRERHVRVYHGDTEKDETVARIWEDAKAVLSRQQPQKHSEFESFQ